MKFINFMISGGGIYGITMCGIIKMLDKYNLLKNIKKYLGTSVGSIICLLLIINYNIDEIIEFIINFDFNLLTISHNNFIDNLNNKYAIYENKNIKFILNNLLIAKNIDHNITFNELFKITNKDLIINVSSINEYKNIFINHINYPNFKVVDIVIASCSIPFIFPPVIINNIYYVDGGLFNNIPLFYFNDEINKTISIFPKEHQLSQFNNFENYLINIIVSIINKNEIKYNSNDIIYFEFIDDIKFNKFHINLEDKQTLLHNGYNIGINFIKNNYYYEYYKKKNLNYNIYG